MREILSVRKELVSEKVFQCLEITDISAYPVNPRMLVKNLFQKTKGSIPVVLNTYSDYAKFLGKTVEELIISPFNSSEGATIFLKDRHIFAIFYNDTVKTAGRINWTIAHELGHVMLNHYKYISPILLGQAPKSSEYSAVLEKEADLFAKYLLCHPIVLGKSSLTDYTLIARTCRISKEAAANTLKDLRIIKIHKEYNIYDEKIVKKFYNFIYTKKCSRCHKIFTYKDAVFCPVCGNTKINWYNGPQGKYQKDYGNFIYCSCPVCMQNLAYTDAPHCTACKTPLTNRCSDNLCRQPLKKDARFCHFCGSKSMYFATDLLTAWQF